MKKYILSTTILLFIASFSVPAVSNAQTSTASMITSIQSQIASLLGQINGLRNQVAVIKSQSTVDSTVATNAQTNSEGKKERRNNRSLWRGLSGDDVRQIQEWLSQDREIYPEAQISGYFGPATEKAIKRFQKKYGIDQIGIVGPKTWERLEQIFARLEKRLERVDERLDDIQERIASSSSNGTSKILVCHTVENKHGMDRKISLQVSANSLQVHLAHGDYLGACNGNGQATTTDRIAPQILGLGASVGASTATVAWTTNEPASSQVWFATSSPVMTSPNKNVVSNPTLSTSHSLNLGNLNTNTLYYYIAVAKDTHGNSATSSVRTFTTTSTPSDTTPPVVFGVTTASGVGKANIMWLTDESTKSRLYYSTSADIMNNLPLSISDTSLQTSHNLEITSLSANTIYYFLINATDNVGNTSTSTSNLYTFATIPLVISSIANTSTTTSATVNWNTNTPTDSKIIYATSTPVINANPTYSVTDTAFVPSHNLNLTNLTANATYYFAIISKDPYGNSATSSDNLLMTL